MTGRKSRDDRAIAFVREAANDVEGLRLSVGFIACPHLAEHQRSRAAENASESKLRQHAIESIWPLIDIFEEQHASRRRIECVRCAERRRQLRNGASKQRANGF